MPSPIIKFALFSLINALCSMAIAAPPASVEKAVCRPVFKLASQSLSAGTAFLLDVTEPSPQTVLVSAIHLFGPAGGLPEQIPAADLAQKVAGVRCTALATHEVWFAGHALTIPNAKPLDSGYKQDVAAFVFDSGKTDGQPVHLKLARQAPKVGDQIWLLAQVAGGAPDTQLLHRATVRQAKDDGLIYQYDNAALELRATSGAPLINADGDVVGVNLGGGNHNGLVGVGDSLTSLRSALASAR
ncbi:MAG TPA: hypothetical protein VIF60_15225 [Burkholderiaceae bacterium]|jgi:hypothetical protein